VDAAFSEARERGVNSVPSMFVNGWKVDWAGYDLLFSALKDAEEEAVRTP
jgi:hypothetical protein